jgi:hypothetical protein
LKNNINQENYESFIDYTILNGFIGLSSEISIQDREAIMTELEARRNFLQSTNGMKFQTAPIKDSNFKPKILLNTREEINYHLSLLRKKAEVSGRRNSEVSGQRNSESDPQAPGYGVTSPQRGIGYGKIPGPVRPNSLYENNGLPTSSPRGSHGNSNPVNDNVAATLASWNLGNLLETQGQPTAHDFWVNTT